MSSSHEKLFLSRAQCFAVQPTGRIPDPPVFMVSGLRYTVPPYYGYTHSETQWLLNMVKANNWQRISRVLSVNPCYLSNTYCQMPDSPEPPLGQPMFHRKAMLYLTPLALAIYLRQHKLASRMLSYVSDTGTKAVDVNQPCFVTNYIERFEGRNDIMLIYLFCIVFRRESFDCIHLLLENGWLPQEEIEMPYRRIGQLFTFHYKDIVEYCLAQMVSRPNLRLPKLLDCLIQAYHDNFTLLTFENVVITVSEEKEVEDFVSIPRRLLRYINYYDRDMRVLSQVIFSIRIIQQSGFYVGPRRDPLAITFTPPHTGTDEDNMINDQDNSIALILAICDEAEIKGHTQSREKSLEVLGHILVDTKWFVHFLQTDSSTLSDYFSNLIERINKIRGITIDMARTKLASLIDVSEIDAKTIKELYNPKYPKRNWKENLGSYIQSQSRQSSNNNIIKKKNIKNDKIYLKSMEKNQNVNNETKIKNINQIKNIVDKKVNQNNNKKRNCKNYPNVTVINVDDRQKCDVEINFSHLL